jgi:WD40 repeat protein
LAVSICPRAFVSLALRPLPQHDVLALAWRPDGKQLASSTLDGQIYFWDPHDAVLQVWGLVCVGCSVVWWRESE